ncbi:hypothetical protein [Micromonospora sp. B9E7]|uniref:hypothetical protein n=1 Tax=Micromonospora sp. B9E7 TaxID=3153574 RepID=UPI00325E4C73
MTPARRPTGRGAWWRAAVVAAGLVVGLPALTVALFVLDGREITPRGVLTIFLFALLLAAFGAAATFLTGRRLSDPQAARTADRTVRRALRAGQADDPRIDSLARREAEHRIGGRWVLWFFGAGMLLEALLGPVSKPLAGLRRARTTTGRVGYSPGYNTGIRTNIRLAGPPPGLRLGSTEDFDTGPGRRRVPPVDPGDRRGARCSLGHSGLPALA